MTAADCIHDVSLQLAVRWISWWLVSNLGLLLCRKRPLCPLYHSRCFNIFLLGHSRPLFLFSSFHYSWEHIWICGWLDSNRGPLVSKATAQPTAPEPHCFNIVHLQCRDNVDNATHNCENDLGPKPFWRLLNFSAIDRKKFWYLTTYQVKCKLGAFMWA